MTSKITLISGLTVVAFSLFAHGSYGQVTELEEAKEAIAASNAVYFTAFVKNDPSIFIDCYAKDACIMSPGMSAMCGKDAPAAFYKMAYEDFGLRNGRFITQEVFGVGDGYVAEVGLWESYNEAGELYDDGKFLVLWKKTTEGWKMFRDSFSSNRASN